CLKTPLMWRSLKSRSLRAEMRTGLAGTLPERAAGPDSLVAVEPAAPTISRRGVLGLVGGSSLVVFLLTAGQSIGTLRPVSLLSPRTQSYGDGPDDFQVNRTAAAAGIRPSSVGPDWALEVVAASNGRTVRYTRPQLMAMRLRSAELPIACVEGWSVQKRWTGVPLSDLAASVGVGHPTGARVESLERAGAFARASLSGHQVRAREALLALQVGGADLSADHGYPARTIIPAAPGVHNTKWVARIVFDGAAV
ncbi:MAG TPA: molybdopterin-dependent oxidoreductase, partial [Acidimicrobiales bacterium]|nr:molybdopterin-dependent oxidoreductase [Acidimicrobiales bacterium]